MVKNWKRFGTFLAVVSLGLGYLMYSNIMTAVELRAENRAMTRLLAQQGQQQVIVPDSNGQRPLVGESAVYAAEVPAEKPAEVATPVKEVETPVAQPLVEQVVSTVKTAEAAPAPSAVAPVVEASTNSVTEVAEEEEENDLVFLAHLPEITKYDGSPLLNEQGEVRFPAVDVYTSAEGKSAPGIINYDPTEMSRLRNAVHQEGAKDVIKRTGTLEETVKRVQGSWAPRIGDNSFAFNEGNLVYSQVDVNEQGDSEPTNLNNSGDYTRIVNGHGVLVVDTISVRHKGKIVKIWIELVYRGKNVGINGIDADMVGNVREYFSKLNKKYSTWSDEKVFLVQARDYNGKHDDPAFFIDHCVVIPDNTCVSIKDVVKSAITERQFVTYAPTFSGADFLESVYKELARTYGVKYVAPAAVTK